MTDDDVPSLGRWHDAVAFVRKHGGVVFIKDVARAFGIREPYASRLLAQAVLSGKVSNLEHQKGWMAVA